MTPPKGSEVALLPCPFCNGEARIQTRDDGAMYVECSECECCTTCFLPLKDHVLNVLAQVWNKRAGSEREAAFVEAARAYCDATDNPPAVEDMSDEELCDRNNALHMEMIEAFRSWQT